MRRYEGAWHLEEKTFLPDSFVVEEEEPTFLDELPPQQKIILLNREGQTFLQEFCGSDHHIVLSKGRIRNGKTEVRPVPCAAGTPDFQDRPPQTSGTAECSGNGACGKAVCGAGGCGERLKPKNKKKHDGGEYGMSAKKEEKTIKIQHWKVHRPVSDVI